MTDSAWYFRRGGKKYGHAFLITGYDDKAEHYICTNSWGENWGYRSTGTFFVHYDDVDALFRSYVFLPYEIPDGG